MKSQGEFQILTRKYWVLIERPFLKKTTLVSFLKAKNMKKSLLAKRRLPTIYNSVKSVHLGLSHIV